MNLLAFTDTIKSKYHTGVNYCYTSLSSWQSWIPDSLKIIWLRDKFLMNELMKRSLKSDEGYAMTTLRIPFYPIHFMVVTGKTVFSQAVKYGEPQHDNPAAYDPEARMPFDPLKELLGVSTIVNETGPSVPHEKRKIKALLSDEAIAEPMWNIVGDTFRAAADNDSFDLKEEIQHLAVKSLGYLSCDLPVEDFTPDYANLLDEGEHAVFNKDEMSTKDFESISRKIRDGNDAIINKNIDRLKGSSNYIKYLSEEKKISDTYAGTNMVGGLLVVSNVVSLITGTLLKIIEQPLVRARLQQALKELGNVPRDVDGYHRLKADPTLHALYLEALRYFSPAGPIARYASKEGKLGELTIPARTYIFAMPRIILHDSKHWENPEKFDPTRFKAPFPHMSEYPFIPFSVGARACPASRLYVEVLFKITMMTLCMNYDLKLSDKDQKIEVIPVFTKQPRMVHGYQVHLDKQQADGDQSKRNESGVAVSDDGKLRTTHQNDGAQKQKSPKRRVG